MQEANELINSIICHIEGKHDTDGTVSRKIMRLLIRLAMTGSFSYVTGWPSFEYFLFKTTHITSDLKN